MRRGCVKESRIRVGLLLQRRGVVGGDGCVRHLNVVAMELIQSSYVAFTPDVIQSCDIMGIFIIYLLFP